MTPKFNKTDLVEVAGDATGYGDLQGVITEIELSDILGEPYYTVRVKSDEVQKVYVAERFISRIDMIGLIQELTMKAALDSPKLIDPSTSMQEAFQWAYKRSIRNQCQPYVILRPTDEYLNKHAQNKEAMVLENVKEVLVKNLKSGDYIINVGRVKSVEEWKNVVEVFLEDYSSLHGHRVIYEKTSVYIKLEEEK